MQDIKNISPKECLGRWLNFFGELLDYEELI